MGKEVFACRKNEKFQAPIKWAQPFLSLELRAKIFTDMSWYHCKPPVRGVRWARETGAICQIGVLTRKRCIFWAQKGLFGRPCLCPNGTKQSMLAKIHFFTRSQDLEGKIAIFTVLKWGKGQNHYENHDLGHNHWKRSAKRPKINLFWTQMCTASRWERQFDKWHPFHAYTGGEP